MANLFEGMLGKRIGSTRIVPLVTKIVVVFAVFILASNLATNYINLMFNRTELIKLNKELLVNQLKDIYTFSTSQYDIYQYSQDLQKSMANIEESAKRNLKFSKSLALGIAPDGTVAFSASLGERLATFPDTVALTEMGADAPSTDSEGSISFNIGGFQYFGVYKYNAKWNLFILRADELNELYARSQVIFGNVSLIILGITVLSTVIGVILIRFILRFVRAITSALMKMQQDQQMELIDLKGAPNDEIAFLGVSFNALSSTINNLVTIFRKFVSRDLAIKAYREKEIKLEGSRMELTVLFSDIKSFTNMTETLGNDIIKLLNIHYERAIGSILDKEGIIGSLIGDAVLAVYGTFPESSVRKSLDAIRSAYKIQENAAQLRVRMTEKREEIIRTRGSMTAEEERIYRAVLLEVGVGIDGGDVFYGNIGSQERMTNTVIGDNVNSASRLEGLTRIYAVPVICSDFVKDDIEDHVSGHGVHFQEIDQVQVKGKTTGKRIYWAILEENLTPGLAKDLELFSAGLASYYEGDWKKAYEDFIKCTLPLAEVFNARTKSMTCPKGWNGIWTMTTK